MKQLTNIAIAAGSRSYQSLAGLLVALIALAACAGESARSFSDGVFYSKSDPPLTVVIDPQFRYLGYDRFILKETAAVERHHWITTSGGKVDAMIIFQFEGLLDGIEGAYEFNTPGEEFVAGSNYRFSPDPVRLGDQEYVHNTWAFDNRISVAENPGAESARTLDMLAKHSLRIDDGLIMSRYVRAVGDDRRKELILFYIEPLSRSGHTIDQFPDGEPRSDIYNRLAADVVARGLAVMEVVEY